jgi:hypothetical protein
MEVVNGRPGAKGRMLALRLVFIMAANLIGVGAINLAMIALTGADIFHAGGVPETAAAFVGILHLSFGFTAAAIRMTARFEIDPERADELRREGRALLLGSVVLVAAGLSLVVLSLAGPDRPIPPQAGAIAAIGLQAFALILAAVRLRRMDELTQEMTRDAGRLAFQWLTLVGGTWAALAHLGYLRAPAPLEWLALMGAFSFVAGLVALAKRGGFGSP